MNAKIGTVIFFVMLGVLYFGSLDRIALTDPDEVFYSQTAREMLDQKSFMTPVIFGHPQFEKPPLMYWLLAGSFKTFGLNPLAARLIPAAFGFFGILMTFYFCRRVFNEEIADLASIILGTSALYLVMSKAVLTDIVLSVFMIAAFYAFYLWFLERKQRYLYAFALASALAVLTKGPVAVIILVISCALFLAVEKEFKLLKAFVWHPWVLVFALVAVPWYAFVLVKYGRVFVDEFIIHDHWHRILYAEHKSFDRWYFYPMIMTAGLFPWTFYLVMMGRWWKEYKKEYVFFLIWFVVTFVIFQKAHSKLASYILPLMPALVIPLSISLSSWTRCSKRTTALAFMYGVLGVGLMVAPLILVKKFPDYVWPIAFVAIRIFAAALIVAGIFLFKGKFMRAIITQATGLAIMFVLIGLFIPSSIDRAVANQYVKDVIEREHYQGQPIVTNKLFARGIYFYTGNPVVVMDHDKQPFWSPHPIEVISNDREIAQFFEGKDRMICVLKDSYVKDLDRILGGRRINRVVAKDGHKVVIVSDKLKDKI